MKYFTQLASGFDIGPALEELERLGTLGFDEGAHTVPLYQHPALVPGIEFQNTHYSAAHGLLREACKALGSPEVYAAVLRVLPPHSKIPRHQDQLATANPRRSRYHLALRADRSSVFVIRDERCHFASGELWRVDLLNRPHHVVNSSDCARVMLMIDTLDRPMSEAAIQKAHEQLAKAFGPDWQQMLTRAALA